MSVILKPIESILWIIPTTIASGISYFVKNNKAYINNEQNNFVDFSDNVPKRKEVHYDISYFENKMNAQLKKKEENKEK